MAWAFLNIWLKGGDLISDTNHRLPHQSRYLRIEICLLSSFSCSLKVEPFLWPLLFIIRCSTGCVVFVAMSHLLNVMCLTCEDRSPNCDDQEGCEMRLEVLVLYWFRVTLGRMMRSQVLLDPQKISCYHQVIIAPFKTLSCLVCFCEIYVLSLHKTVERIHITSDIEIK